MDQIARMENAGLKNNGLNHKTYLQNFVVYMPVSMIWTEGVRGKLRLRPHCKYPEKFFCVPAIRQDRAGTQH